jgi:DNA-directed RNA polymerase sigma subunit (sigma70/sigma32)
VLSQLHQVVRTAFDYRRFGLTLGDLINEGIAPTRKES